MMIIRPTPTLLAVNICSRSWGSWERSVTGTREASEGWHSSISWGDRGVDTEQLGIYVLS